MAPKSRVAQELLTKLEEGSAPFHDQLVEAAKFVGSDIDAICRSSNDVPALKLQSKAVIFHGREEWLLRWLLKKLQAPADVVPRTTASSWQMLLYLICLVPMPVVARILVERKFPSILQRTLQDTTEIAAQTGTANSGSLNADDALKSTRKRKRSGELGSPLSTRDSLRGLLEAIHSTTDFIVRHTRPIPESVSEGGNSAFAAEYMRTVIRCSAEDASKILGSWASILGTPSLLLSEEDIPWLSPFIEIWENHVSDSNELINFSLHCTLPLLSLRSSLGSTGEIVAHIEQLLARNIVIPAKSARLENAESTLFNDLARISVIYSPLNAACLFDIAIRTTQPQGMKRRRQHDESWLQAVFATLRAAMPPKKFAENGKAVCAMLQSALRHKVELELPVLQSITADFGLPDDTDANWELIYMIIKLDANVFLIPTDEESLLQKLLRQITRSSLKTSWPEVSEAVMGYAPIPLMHAFAMGRDLSGFMRIWFSQLVESASLLEGEVNDVSAPRPGAWEDQLLLDELKKVLETSLTTQQIGQILDWLEQEAGVNPHAACVILEAISGSITQEELVDAINLRCYRIIFDEKVFKNLDKGCKWGAWKILFNTLQWATPAMVDELADSWKTGPNPFGALFGKGPNSSSLLIGNITESETFEAFRCACAVWSIAKTGSQMQQIATPLASGLLLSLRGDIKTQVKHTARDSDATKDAQISKTHAMGKGSGSKFFPFLRCVFDEYPKVLTLASEIEDGLLREMMQTVLWLASIKAADSAARLDWVWPDCQSFRHVWESTLQCDDVLNNSTVIETAVDITLESSTNLNNPFIKSPTNNYFAAEVLLKLPTNVMHRKQRERIMQSWLPEATNSTENTDKTMVEHNSYDSAVLALKIKTMRQPMFYEGMSFRTLLDLTDALQHPEVEHTQVNLALFKELARLTLDFVSSQVEQQRNKEYITEAFNYVRKSVRKAHEKSKHALNSASINLFEVVLKNLDSKSTVLKDLAIVDNDELVITVSLFKGVLLQQLQKIVRKLGKAKPDREQQSTTDNSTLIFSITAALVALGRNGSQVPELADEIMSLISATSNAELGERLKWFLNFKSEETLAVETLRRFEFDTSTISGRQSIIDVTQGAIDGLDNTAKLALLKTMLVGKTTDLNNLGILLSIRHIIISIEDARRRKDDKDDDDEDSSDSDDDLPFDLSAAYSILCSHLWKSAGVRQFCLLSETLAVMLSTKARAISQWNIDSTIGSISITCSQNGPHLRPSRASTIFLHLCDLLQAVLTSHRLKLEGHLHIIVQALQALLRCLFLPLPHSSAKTLKNYAPPPWLSSTAAQLEAKHAAAYTRLITLICDPSVSSVTRSRHNNLTSATERAKRMASQHMQFVLATYIKLQLEMRMRPEVRDKMVPGLYAIFDTTTPELRRCISDSLDSSGRAVFGTLYKDYLRFGKWKGS